MTLIAATASRSQAEVGEATLPQVRRFSVAEYHRMLDTGVLDEGETVELLEGWVLQKMPKGPLHEAVIDRMREVMSRFVPPAWRIRVQSAITTSDSEPEPDLAIAIGPAERYLSRHPGPGDLALVVEVADSSLAFDREEKGRVYARAGIWEYWVVNLKEMVIEAYRDPSGQSAEPAYQSKSIYRAGDMAPINLREMGAVQVPVGELLL